MDVIPSNLKLSQVIQFGNKDIESNNKFIF